MQKGKKFLSELKLYSDYFKWNEQLSRYENWEEACENIILGHEKKYGKKASKYLESALESMKSRLVLASQRSLQYRYNEINKHNARIYNCTSTHLCRNRAFQEIFYLALCGCGVGVGLLKPFVNNLSELSFRENGVKSFTIEDSIEGWADALGVLLSSYFVDNQPFPEYAGYKIKFDFSLIREKGSFISGGFKAPGHEGLKKSLEDIENLIDNWLITEGSKIRPILAFDIICYSANAVLSGGVRRSALNMIVDPYDEEMIHAKIGNWLTENPQRARSNNSVLFIRDIVKEDEFNRIVELNNEINDIGFVFANSWFDMFNPCFEIAKIPVLDNINFSKIHYEDIENYVRLNKNKFGIQGCNLSEINAELCKNDDIFLRACKDASILGTLQAGYTNFPYLGDISEKIFQREALLGVSITGWMNNPKLFNKDLLKKGAKIVKDTNKELAQIIGINPAARTTCVKPSGNASVVLGTASGIHPEHSERYFRIMQLNKEADTAKWLKDNMEFLLEESEYSATKSDYVVFIPVENPKEGLYKKDMKGIKHLELIKLVQEYWVKEGTNEDLCVYKGINHNTSCTVIIDNKKEISDYIWKNKDLFTAVSFISDYGDKDFNQAPFTSVLNLEEIIKLYGEGALFAAGLIVDGLHYFDNNLWNACSFVLNKDISITGTREQVLLKKYWVSRAKKFAKNYFKNDLKTMIYCLKDVHLFHKWKTINRSFKEVSFEEILQKPSYKEVSDFASMACSGGSCEINRI
jgi:ribonucleoside-diphosphate reductase alpha chain